MILIADEDVARIEDAVKSVFHILAGGVTRVDQNVLLGDDCPALIVSGYWVNDIARIDVKVKL